MATNSKTDRKPEAGAMDTSGFDDLRLLSEEESEGLLQDAPDYIKERIEKVRAERGAAAGTPAA